MKNNEIVINVNGINLILDPEELMENLPQPILERAVLRGKQIRDQAEDVMNPWNNCDN